MINKVYTRPQLKTLIRSIKSSREKECRSSINQDKEINKKDTHSRKAFLPNAEVREPPISKKIESAMQILPVSLQQMEQPRQNSEAERMDIDDSNSPSQQHKRSATTNLTVDLRKNKGTKTTHGYEPRAHHFWYGFPIMEAIAATAGDTPEAIRLQIPDLVELGWLENEALDFHNGKISFPHVRQHF